jgi:transposase
VRICWRKRRWVCPDAHCLVGTFVEQDERVAAPRSSLTTRVCRWAIEHLRREHASVNGIRRQLGTGWRTVWEAIKPMLAAADADRSRFDGVTILGVDEHMWHHVSTKPVDEGGRGPKELTGMVDLTRDEHGRTRARLLDLVPGRSGAAYATWLTERGPAFHSGVAVATLDPFHGYKNAIDDELTDAVAVLDAFHVVKVATQVVDEVRRRVQQDTCGHRGHRNDPLYRIRNILRPGAACSPHPQV